MDQKEKKELRQHDFITSLILLGFGLVMLVQSIKMTFFVNIRGVEEVGWFVAPGVFPLILSCGLIIMSLSIMITALREGGQINRQYLNRIVVFLKSADFRILILEAVILFLYVFVFLRNLPFVIATILYLFLAMIIVKASRWYMVVIISLLVAWAVYYLFGTFFKVPLP